MKYSAFLALLLTLTSFGMVQEEKVVSEPLGFNRVTCLANSDTIIGVPLRKTGSRVSSLSTAPSINGDRASLTLTHDNLYSSGLPSHYLKFTSGAKSGFWYHITGCTASSITVDLNGDSLDGVVGGESLLIAPYWTLDTLFPPSGATTSWTETFAGSGEWTPNGHAVVASSSTLISGRRTEILLPNVSAAGINLPAEGRYFIHGGVWKKSSSGHTNYGSTILYPDVYFTISHPTTVVRPTTFKASGGVDTESFVIQLNTRANVPQDNFVALLRPVNVTLDGLNLRQSGAFVPSTSTLTSGRRDQLLVFNNEQALRNRTPSAVYYVHGGIWKLSSGGNTDRSSVVIPAGTGFIIRKYQTPGGVTSYWNNTPSY